MDGEHLDRLYLVNIEKNQTYHALEAKAAHGIIKEDIKTEITPTESVKVQAVKTGDNNTNGLLVYTYRSFINCYAFILY